MFALVCGLERKTVTNDDATIKNNSELLIDLVACRTVVGVAQEREREKERGNKQNPSQREAEDCFKTGTDAAGSGMQKAKLGEVEGFSLALNYTADDRRRQE